jgi:DNA-directed RNA polymerase sigma subunit (sigma70/sigma32)
MGKAGHESNLPGISSDELCASLARTILARRHGLTGGEPESLDRIANRLGLSRECVRRLERAALARLATACAPAAPAQR